MLKLSLKEGQYVNIGDDIRIVFAGGTGKHCRLLIEAPKELISQDPTTNRTRRSEKIHIIPTLRFPMRHKKKYSASFGRKKRVRKRRKATNHVNRRLWHLPHPGSRLL